MNYITYSCSQGDGMLVHNILKNNTHKKWCGEYL